MKLIVLTNLSILLVCAIIPVAQAQSTSTSSVDVTSVYATVTPFDLVSLAYQGFLEGQGIPKFNGLIFGYRTGKVTAEELVQAAIDTRRLSPDTINDRRYLTAVERHLESLFTNSN
jgi:hypothetical protein